MFQINNLIMKLINLCPVVIYFILFSCQNKKENNTDVLKVKFNKSNYFDENRVNEDKYNVVCNGDELAYADLQLYYSYNSLRQHEIVPYSLIIFEKYKKYDLSVNVFNNLLEFYTNKKLNYDGTKMSIIIYFKNLNNLNREQKNYLSYFLKTGASNDDSGARMYLELLYREGLGVEKNLKKADSLLSILNATPAAQCLPTLSN